MDKQVDETTITGEPDSSTFCSHSIDESRDGAIGPSEYIILSRCSVIDPVPLREAKENFERVKYYFMDLLKEIKHALMSIPNPVHNVCLLLDKLCIDVEGTIPFFDCYTSSQFRQKDLTDIFGVLIDDLKVVGPIKLGILRDLVSQLVPPDNDVHGCLKHHGELVSEFQRNTFIREYVVSADGPNSHAIGFATITVKFNKSYNQYTLSDLAVDQAYLAQQLQVREEIFNFIECQKGCVTITWQIPKSALQLFLPPNVNEHRVGLLKGKVDEISVNDKYLYKFEPTTVSCILPQKQELLQKRAIEYQKMYDASITKPDDFWGSQAKKTLTWMKMFTEVNGCDVEKGLIKWFSGGTLNVSVNCLDRHVEKHGESTAIICERNRTKDQKHGTHDCLSYRKLLEMTCRIANVLIDSNIKRGDRVIIYMPTCAIAVAAMLACARIGAVHCVLYPVLKKMDIVKRIKSSNARAIIASRSAVIGDKHFNLKENVDEALKVLEKQSANTVHHILTWELEECEGCTNTQGCIDLKKAMDSVPEYCDPVEMQSEDPLFIMYTSGATKEPTGIVHTQAGYLLSAALSQKYVFDYKEGEVFACVSDLGWIAAHTYSVYGPLCNGATSVLFEGTATYPDSGRYWEMVERLEINHLYTTPPAIRHLMNDRSNSVQNYDTSSLKTIASGGEPLSSSAWTWCYKDVGKENCVVIDTYGQTELGGIAFSQWPIHQNSGVFSKPFFGVEPIIIDEKEGILKEKGCHGLLYLKNPTPAMGREVINGNKMKYFNAIQPKYDTGDWAYRDINGDYQIVGRCDDMVRIKGVWVQVCQIESLLSDISDNIICGTYIKSLDGNICAIIERSRGVYSKQIYMKIMSDVKERVVSVAGEQAVPHYVLVSQEGVRTVSQKISRSFWRQWTDEKLIPVLEGAPDLQDRDKMVLFDISATPLIPLLDETLLPHWSHLSHSFN